MKRKQMWVEKFEAFRRNHRMTHQEMCNLAEWLEQNVEVKLSAGGQISYAVCAPPPTSSGFPPMYPLPDGMKEGRNEGRKGDMRACARMKDGGMEGWMKAAEGGLLRPPPSALILSSRTARDIAAEELAKMNFEQALPVMTKVVEEIAEEMELGWPEARCQILARQILESYHPHWSDKQGRRIRSVYAIAKRVLLTMHKDLTQEGVLPLPQIARKEDENEAATSPEDSR